MTHTVIVYQHGRPMPWVVIERVTGRVLAATDGSLDDAERLAATMEAACDRRLQSRRAAAVWS